MSHFLALQEEKKDARATRSEPVMDDVSFLVPPQEEKSEEKTSLKTSGQSWLIPPQQQRVDVAALRGEQARLDQVVGRFGEQVNQRRIEHEDPTSVDDLGRHKQQRDAILSGAAGVTAEYLGIAENHRVVRSRRT